MNRLKLFILLFFIAVSFPLGFVIWHSYLGLEQEERAQLRFFSEKLFDQMEGDLAELVQQEEIRAVDEYQYFLASAEEKGGGTEQVSPLATPPREDFILGYLQNNPDGSMQTPQVADMGAVPEDMRDLVTRLRQANQIFNNKKFIITKPAPVASPRASKPVEKDAEKESFAERFLSRSKTAPAKTYLGKKKQRIEEITPEQAYNIAPEERSFGQRKMDEAQLEESTTVLSQAAAPESVDEKKREDYAIGRVQSVAEEQEMFMADAVKTDGSQSLFQAEVAPFQSVLINDDLVYIFRRIGINNEIYRQGFLIEVEPFLRHLITSHFAGQPLADFTALQIQRRDQANSSSVMTAGVAVDQVDFITTRVFPAPFDFLEVSISANGIPSSPARSSLNFALGILGLFMVLGFVAIYQSARTIVLMSERRSQFVSSVTHELKTPLTNIRMYIEMLEQGVAATPEREQEYLSILGSESARLSGLINNVLDLAKLEKKQRHFHFQEGNLDDVLSEVETIMSPKLQQEGFNLKIQTTGVPLFNYDRDVLIQVLMNLIENSVKFGKHCPQKEISIAVEQASDEVLISVSDTGPGIPRRSLKKIFDDFYRVDNDLTRKTGGTGIGLALVKKFVEAMGGRVRAVNNNGAGCTITLMLPSKTL